MPMIAYKKQGLSDFLREQHVKNLVINLILAKLRQD